MVTDEQYEKIREEAVKRFRQYQNGIRGQTITNQDSFDWWLVAVTAQHLREMLTETAKMQQAANLEMISTNQQPNP